MILIRNPGNSIFRPFMVDLAILLNSLLGLSDLGYYS